MLNLLRLMVLFFPLVSAGGCGDKKSTKTKHLTEKVGKIGRLESGESEFVESIPSKSTKALVSSQSPSFGKSGNFKLSDAKVEDVSATSSVESVIKKSRSRDVVKVQSDILGLVAAGVPITILYDRVEEYLDLSSFSQMSQSDKTSFLSNFGKSLVGVYNLYQTEKKSVEGGSSDKSNKVKEITETFISSVPSNFFESIKGIYSFNSSEKDSFKSFFEKTALNYCEKLIAKSKENTSLDLNSVSSKDSKYFPSKHTSKFYLLSYATPEKVGYYYNGKKLEYKDFSLSTYLTNFEFPSQKGTNPDELDSNFFSGKPAVDLKKGVFIDWNYEYQLGSNEGDLPTNKGYLRGMLVDGISYSSADNFKQLFNNGNFSQPRILGGVDLVRIFVKNWQSSNSRVLKAVFSNTNGYILEFADQNKSGTNFQFKKIYSVDEQGTFSEEILSNQKNIQSIFNSNFFGRRVFGVHYVTPSKIVCTSCSSGGKAQEDGALQVDCGKSSDSCSSSAKDKGCMTKKNDGKCDGEIYYREFVPFGGSVLLLSTIDGVEDFQKIYKSAKKS